MLDYGAIVWRRKVLVILIVVGMAGAAAGVSSLQQPTWLATSELVLAQQQLDSNYNLEVQELSARQMDTQIALLKSDAVADRARRKGVTATVDATSTAESNLVHLVAIDSDPQRAADAANAYVDAYREITAEGVAKTLDDAEEQLKNRITLLQGQIDPLVKQLNVATGAGRTNAQTSVGGLLSGLQQQQAGLQAQLGRIEVQRALADSSTVVQRAVPPDVPVGPKPLQDGLLAGVLGMLIGISVAVLLHLRRRPTDRDVSTTTGHATPGHTTPGHATSGDASSGHATTVFSAVGTGGTAVGAHGERAAGASSSRHRPSPDVRTMPVARTAPVDRTGPPPGWAPPDHASLRPPTWPQPDPSPGTTNGRHG